LTILPKALGLTPGTARCKIKLTWTHLSDWMIILLVINEGIQTRCRVWNQR
jgi:hypothetical protein